MTQLKRETIPRRNEEAEWREVEEEVYICSIDGETMFSITGVGADIWRVCDGEHTVAEIAELLLTAYEVDRDTLEKDLAEFLDDMKAKGLITFE